MNEKFQALKGAFKDNKDLEILHRSELQNSEYYTNEDEVLENWDEGDYLVIMDAPNGKQPLAGAYYVEIDDKGEFIMSWCSYPESPIVGLENIIEHLKRKIK